MSDGVYIRQGKSATLGITATQQVSTVPKDFAIGQCRLVRVNVLVAGSAGGAAYDSASLTGNSAANQIGAWPNTVGSYLIDMPCLAGIVIAPGAGQTVSVSYD
ncbi:hypothetical protein [Ralstonia solanacearum]|uniref:hypothetical protein n=1 Tax=Ralstonia solanacearum TaxID=305 RepID=UPI003D806401